MIKDEYKYSAITEQIIGCAMKVHNTLGNGFQDVIYQRALAIEIGIAGLEFAREVEMPVFYGEQEIGTRRVDFLVADKFRLKIHESQQADACTSGKARHHHCNTNPERNHTRDLRRSRCPCTVRNRLRENAELCHTHYRTA